MLDGTFGSSFRLGKTTLAAAELMVQSYLMNCENTPKDEGEKSVPEVQEFLEPAAPPEYLELTAGEGSHLVLKNEPPKRVAIPLSTLFEGVGPDDFIAYGTGPETEGLIMRPIPEDKAD